MGIAERKEREREEMRNLILQAANKLFLQQGLEKTSIRNIADAIEYSPATIYLYFKDKDEIFLALHDQYFGHFFGVLKQADSIDNPLQRLRKMGDLYLEFALANREYYEVMFMMEAPLTVLKRKEEEWNCGLQSFGLLRSTVEECMEKGLVKPMDLDTAAFLIFSTAHGMVSLLLKDRLDMFPKDQHLFMFQNALDNLINILKKD